MTTISAFEHGTLHVGAGAAGERSDGSLTAAQFDALARFNDAHGQRYFRLGHRRLTFTSHVGYLQVGKLGIEVLPKLGRETQRADHHARWQALLLEMLRVAAGLPLHSPTDTLRHVGRPTLLELVALRLTAEIERLLHEGLSKCAFHPSWTPRSRHRGHPFRLSGRSEATLGFELPLASGVLLSDRRSLEIDLVRVVHQSIQDSVS